MKRSPAVAGRFYPGDPEMLRQTLARLIPASEEGEKEEAKAVVIPHAGYVYSGDTVGKTMGRVHVPETVVLLGPNHYGIGADVALSRSDWDMPMGTVPVDQAFCELLLTDCSEIKVDQIAHSREHSLEVQLPFLHFLNAQIRIVPLVFSHIPFTQCENIARSLVRCIRDSSSSVLLVASTDMTHYLSRQQATKQDRLAIERILDLDSRGLYSIVKKNNITMCGVIPTAITLLAAGELGATQASLIQYTDSGESSGDTSQVVGYAGLTVT